MIKQQEKVLEVGDVVFTMDRVKTGYSTARNFWTPKTITKETKTQLTLSDGTRILKNNRRVVGERYRQAALEGERVYACLVSDETVKLNAFKKKVETTKRIRHMVGLIGNIPLDNKLSQKQLDALESRVSEVRDLINISI